MLPDKHLSIYPKTKRNLQALIDFYFAKYNINQEGAIKAMKARTSLSLNQIEYILRKMSEAYELIFCKEKKSSITLTGLFSYGISSFEERHQAPSGSQATQATIRDLRAFEKQTEPE